MTSLIQCTKLLLIACCAGFMGFPGIAVGADPTPPAATIRDFPHFLLERGDLQLFVVNPLPPNGYYQGQRFAHSAMVAQAYWKGVPLFAEFTANKEPSHHDHVGGTAEEFDFSGPASFPATSGDTPFLKIGVGLLQRRPDDPDAAYRFSVRYRWVARPSVRVKVVNSQHIVFEERLQDSETGLGYAMQSTVKIREDGNAFEITRKLTNLGREALLTEHYSHNFVRIGDVQIGNDYRVDWSVPIPWETIRDPGSSLVVERSGLTFNRPSISGQVSVSSDAKKDLDLKLRFTVAVESVGLFLQIEPERPIRRAVVWAEPTVISPEPFIAMVIAPGVSETWTTHYEVGEISSLSR